MGKKYMKRKKPLPVDPAEYLGLKRLSYGEALRWDSPTLEEEE